MSDFETEPVRGLPELLPKGEEVLWQGAPQWGALAVRVFQARKMAIYFALLFFWRIGVSLFSGMPVDEAIQAALPVIMLSLAPVGFLAGMGWLTSYVSVYTITTRRVVMRIGIVFSISVNIPFKTITSADLRTYRKGNGDIWLTLAPAGQRVSYVALWPHVRPWRFTPVQPMLRGVPKAAEVAEILANALKTSLDEDEAAKGKEDGAAVAEKETRAMPATNAGQ
ncbi:photosynthetic complex putative assembly protein PuhB [Thiococcus pfennigii]|uniref:photosynthetic complex putative assembly protein PuhB n=1 Tax=Thiococcus pfennigii TaxID=1057 RepID=UPI001906FE61|nr:photosynthetic complex putative assembly protein PuhB [Thiococcus pfennigii]MBK1701576.1 hypothetical protein [Thiococcus pfennigii]